MKRDLCGTIAHKGAFPLWKKRRLHKKIALSLSLCLLLCASFFPSIAPFSGQPFAYGIGAEEDNDHFLLAGGQESGTLEEAHMFADLVDDVTQSDEPADPVLPSETRAPEEVTSSGVFGPIVPAGIETGESGPEDPQQEAPESGFPSSISGFLWVDETMDGLYSAHESPLDKYPVSLYAKSDLDTAIEITKTDSSGEYTFHSVAPGVYAVGIERAIVDAQEYFLYPERTAEHQFVLLDTGEISESAGERAISMDITVEAGSAVTGVNGCVCLSSLPMGGAGQEEGMLNGENTGSISGNLWIDVDMDGTYDAEESPAAYYPVTLYLADNLTDAVKSTETDISGRYSFENVSPGTYVVGVGVEIVRGQQFALFLGGRKNDNQFDMADGWETAETLEELKIVSPELTVGAGTTISGINGCVCLPQSPVPRTLTYNFSAHILVQYVDGTPAAGIKWEIMRGFAAGDGENLKIHEGYTGEDGIIRYEAIGDTVSAPGKRFAYSIYMYFPPTAEMVHAKGSQRMKIGTSDFWTHEIDTDYTLSGSRMVGWGMQDTDTGEDLTAELHFEGPVVMTINAYSYPPTVETGLASSIMCGEARIEGTYDLGKATPRAEGCYFEYGTAPDLTDASYVIWPPIENTGTASVNLTGLQPNTTYYYRICAENRKGTAVGEILSFKTLREITVDFDLQDGSFVQSAVYVETDAFSASSLWATYAEPVRPTYDFAGWYTDAGGNGTEVTGDMSAGDVFPGISGTLYAKWEPWAYELAVSHEMRGGEGFPGAVNYTSEIAHGTPVTLATPNAAGYVFVGWALNGVAQSEAMPSFTMPPYPSDVVLIYGYDRNMNDVEDFAVTKAYRTPSGSTIREAETVHFDVGSLFCDAAIDIDGYVYDHYEIDGVPYAMGEMPAIEVTESGGDFTVNYIYKHSITIRPAPESIVYGEDDPDPVQWLLLVEGSSQTPILWYGSDYTLSIEEDPLDSPYRSAGSYAVTVMPMLPLPGLLDYAITLEEGILTVEKKGNGEHEPGEGDAEHFYGTITIDPQTKRIGAEDPELTCEAVFEGLVGADELSFRLVREPGEEIGAYAITVEWEDSFPANNYDVAAVKIVDNLLTIKGDIEWGELDPGMKDMSFDFGTQLRPIGTVYYSSKVPSHTLRVEDNREEPTKWEIHAQLSDFDGIDGSAFLATITLENPLWDCAWLNVEEAVMLISNDSQSLVMAASDSLENDVVDVTWTGGDVMLFIEESEITNIHSVAYSAQLIWSISDAP